MKKRKIQVAKKLAKWFPNWFSQKVKNPLFIIGCARSGTSLLTRLLSQHKSIANWSEANDIWDPYGYPWRYSNLATLPIEFTPIEFTDRWWRAAEPRGQEVQAVFGAFQWLLKKKVFLNKSPLNTFRIPHILKLFPDARFIHMVRDGRAVTYSYTNKQYEKMQADPKSYKAKDIFVSFDELAVRLAAFWKENLLEVANQDSILKLQEQRKLLEVSYEHLCADSINVLAQICDFVEIDIELFKESVWEVQIDNRNNKWKTGFTSDVIEQIHLQMEPVIMQKGYY